MAKTERSDKVKIGRTSHKCSICNKEISQSKYSWLFIEYLLLDFKIHLHYKFKHKERYFTPKGIVKRVAMLIPFAIINILTLTVVMITYPFWIIHELLN